MTRNRIRSYEKALCAMVEHLPEKEAEAIFDAAENLAALVTTHDSLSRFFLSPAFTKDEKEDVFDAIADSLHLPPIVRSLFLQLLEIRTIAALGSVARAARARDRARRGITEIEVRTAEPLTDDDLSSLLPGLQRLFGERLLIRRVTDPSIIGGIIVRSNTVVHDASIRNHLKILTDVLQRGENCHG